MLYHPIKSYTVHIPPPQDLNLDLLAETTNAPGLSAFNKAERRMYHLSKQMSGVILPHDTYGSHLQNGKTVDEELEKENFEAAGNTLASIFSDLEIDGFEVKADFIKEPAKEETIKYEATASFRSRHVLETQYATYVLKCDDRSCCSKPKTAVHKFFPNRRIPALIPIQMTSSGPAALKLDSEIHKQNIKFPSLAQRVLFEDELTPPELKQKYGKNVPYDAYLPSCQDKVEKRTCKVCYKYHATIKSLNMHKKICKRRPLEKQGGRKRICSGGGGAGSSGAGRGGKRGHQRNVINSLFSSEDSFSDEVEVEKEEEDQAGDSEEEELLELDTVRPKYSVPGEGGVETILNLKEWLLSPWSEEQ